MTWRNVTMHVEAGFLVSAFCHVWSDVAIRQPAWMAVSMSIAVFPIAFRLFDMGQAAIEAAGFKYQNVTAASIAFLTIVTLGSST